MKKGLSLFLAFIFVVGIYTSAPLTANAASVDDLTFELKEDSLSYYVTDCSEEASGEIIIPDTYNGLPVTSIGQEAFAYCSSLTSVTIPDSVTDIGDYAFSYCESLTSVTIPDSVTDMGDYTFSCCESLTSINIPDSVTSIGEVSFCYCTSLSSITIPDSVTSIGGTTFYNCYSLTNVNINF